MTEQTVPSRPSRYSTEVKTNAIREIVGPISVWVEDPSFTSEAIAEDLLRAFDDNAYVFAKRLADRGWDPDAELVELLDGIPHHQSHQDVVKAWVAEHGIKVPFTEGECVATRRWPKALVHKVYHETAIVVLKPESEADKWKDQDGGYLVPFEECTAFVDVSAGEVLA